MAARPRLHVGDVFTVPIDDSSYGLGQIVERYLVDGAWFFVIFDQQWDASKSVDLDSFPGADPLFLALSMDGKLHVGEWKVVGNVPVVAADMLPAYKEASSPGGFQIVDYSGSRRRRATAEELDAVPYRKVVAPVRLENGLKARFGVGPWLEKYEGLRPSSTTTRSLFA